MTAASRPEPSRVRSGTAAGHALLALLVAGGLAWLVTNVPQRAWPGPAEIPVVVEDEHYRVPPQELRWLESFSRLHFSEGREAARVAVAAEIDAQLDGIFDGVAGRLPEFLDWYYSLRGEYSRAAMAALAYADLAEQDYVARRAAATLLPDEAWAEGFGELERQATQRLAAHDMQVREEWLARVTRRLSAHRVPAPLPTPDAARVRRVRLDALTHDIAAREGGALETRLSLSTVAAGAAAAGPVLWRASAARTSAAGGRAAAARVAGRGAARAGTAAAGGAAVCSPGGPAAVGCAVVAGAAAWLGTDWALLRVDEHLNRDDLEAALEASIVALREQVEADLLAAYDGLIADYYGGVQQDIGRAFVPATAGKPAEN